MTLSRRPILAIALLILSLLAVGAWLPWPELVGPDRRSQTAPAVVVPKQAAAADAALVAPIKTTKPLTSDLLVAASVRGFRASTEQRASYVDHLARDADLAALAKALDAAAQTGDADAAATLAELYRHCAEVLRYSPPPRSPKIDRPGRAPFPDELRVQRCAGFGAAGELSSFNLQSTARGWTGTAARLGDPASILASREPGYIFENAPVDEAELRARAAAADLLLEGNFAVLTRYGNTLADLSHQRMRQAWDRTLCEMAAPCERRQRNCGFACDPQLQASELQRMSPRQRRELAGQQLQILQALQSGRFDGLWRQPVAAGGRQ